MLRRPLYSAAGICDDWIKATGEPHHTTSIHTALFLESKVGSSGLTSCSHQTYLGLTDDGRVVDHFLPTAQHSGPEALSSVKRYWCCKTPTSKGS